MKKHWKVLTGVAMGVLLIVFTALFLIPVTPNPSIDSCPGSKSYRIVMDFRAGYQPEIYQEHNIIEGDECVCGGGGSHKGTSLYLDYSDTNFGKFYIPIYSRYYKINDKGCLELFSLTKDQLHSMRPDTTYRLYLFYEKNIFGMRINKHVFVDWESAEK